MSNPEVAAIKDQLTEKLQASGELGSMRAMIVSASLASLKHEETEENQLFKPSQAMLKTKRDDMRQFDVVADWLKAMGLQHTLAVMALESSISKDNLKHVNRADVASGLGVSMNNASSVLEALLANGGSGAGASSAKAPSPMSQHQVASAASSAASSPQKSSTAASSAQQSPAKAAPPAVAPPAATTTVTKKGTESPYEVENWDGGNFVRYNQIEGQPFQGYDLKNCKMFVYDAIATCTMDDCFDCTLVISACSGSIFLRNCHRMKFIGACKQLRTRDCTDMEVNLFGLSDPVVESSSNIIFRPFNLRAPKLADRFKSAGLDAAQNRFVHVYDFTPGSKPNFEVKLKDHGIQMETHGAELGDIDSPIEIEELLTGKREPAASSEKDKGFDIKKGPNQEWTGESSSSTTTTTTTTVNTTSATAKTSGGLYAKQAASQPASAAPASAPAPKLSSMSAPKDDSENDGYDSFEDSDDSFNAKKAARDETDSDDDTF